MKIISLTVNDVLVLLFFYSIRDYDFFYPLLFILKDEYDKITSSMIRTLTAYAT